MCGQDKLELSAVREALQFMKREIAAGLKRMPCQPFICHNLRNVGYSKNLEKEY